MALDKTKHLKSAEKYIAFGKIQQAIAEYLEILKENEQDWNLMIQIGDLYLKINKTQEAIRYFQKVADYYYADGLNLKAMAIYKRINKLDPNQTEICIKLADLYLKQGLTMDAKPQLEVVAQHYLSKNQTKDAIQTLKKLIQIEPDNLRTRNELAKALKNQGMISDAVKEYTEISDVLLCKNLVKESLTALETAYMMDPRNATILRKLVAFYKEHNEKDKTTRFLEESLRFNPTNSEVLTLLAESYIDKDDYTRAHQTLKRLIDIYAALKQTPNLVTTYNQLVDVLISKKSYEEAANALEKLIELEPDKEHYQAKLDLVHSCLSNQSKKEKNGTPVHDTTIPVPLIAPWFSEEITRADFETRREPQQNSVKEPESKKESAESEEAFIPPALLEAVHSLKPTPPVSPVSVLPAVEIPDEESDFILDHMIEADVFIKYELFNKAIEQLMIITGRYPTFITAHQKLKDIYLEQGVQSKAAEECITMSKVLRRQGEIAQAENLLNQARQIDPNNACLEVESALVPQFKERSATPESAVLSEIERLAQNLRAMASTKPKQAPDESIETPPQAPHRT